MARCARQPMQLLLLQLLLLRACVPCARTSPACPSCAPRLRARCPCLLLTQFCVPRAGGTAAWPTPSSIMATKVLCAHMCMHARERVLCVHACMCREAKVFINMVCIH